MTALYCPDVPVEAIQNCTIGHTSESPQTPQALHCEILKLEPKAN